MFGAVVVGVGTAGMVRIRDILEPFPGSAAERLTIKGFISRRIIDGQSGANQISLEEALGREDISVAFICTENTLHQENIRTFLEAGKHICVEYPMTLNYKVAKELCDLAHQKGLILHEEHVELLTADYKQLKREVDGKQLKDGTLHFTGGVLKPGFGFPAFSGIARLTWLVDLFGELTVTAATIEERPDDYMKMTAQLLTIDNKPLTWIEERAPGLPRAKNIRFCFDVGTLTKIPPSPKESIGVFMQDLILFTRKLLGQVPSDELQKEERRILHCLQLAEKIQHLC